jgi:hypothetical protein
MTISPQVALPASYGDAQRTGLTANQSDRCRRAG